MELGSIITKDGTDYIVVCRNGKRCLEPFGAENWHEDLHHVCMAPAQSPPAAEFITAMKDEISLAFPGVSLTAADISDLASFLWTVYG